MVSENNTLVKLKFQNPENQPRLKIGESGEVSLRFLLLKVVRYQPGKGYVSVISQPAIVKSTERLRGQDSLNVLLGDNDVFKKVHVRKNCNLKFYFASTSLGNIDLIKEALKILRISIPQLK